MRASRQRRAGRRLSVLTGPLPVLVSDNLPAVGACRQRWAGRLSVLTGPLEAEAGVPGGEIRVFNHWATGLQSGLLPRIVLLQRQQKHKQRIENAKVCKRNVSFWPQEMSFQVV